MPCRGRSRGNGDLGGRRHVPAGSGRNPSRRVPATAEGHSSCPADVAIRGGFVGTESSLNDRPPFPRPAPDPNASILSGDLAGDDGPNFANNSENSYQVVTAVGTGSSTVLDGFAISGGNANGSSPYDSGGGMYISNGSPTLTNCTFSDNTGSEGGGINCNSSSSPRLTNCTFSGNMADFDFDGYGGVGGGICCDFSSPTLTNCTFSGNTAWSDGGGIDCEFPSYPTLTNCTFSGNTADRDGGGMYCYQGSSPTLTNCTFSGNTAVSGGGIDCSSSSPTLTNCTLSGNTA